MERKERIASLKLFKSLISEENNTNKNVLNDCIKDRILIQSSVTEEEKKDIIETYGLESNALNNTFHKSFSTVKNTDIDTLIAQQLIHYFTTYGLESLGIENKDLIYVPAEKLEIPEITNDIPITIIHIIDKEKLSEKLMTLLTSGIALSKDTIENIMILSEYIPQEKIQEIKNREIKIRLYDKYNTVPCNNVEFIRYLIYKTTGETLVIRNKELIQKIKYSDKLIAFNLFCEYLRVSNENKLAEIFLRYKDLILAYKVDNPTNDWQRNLNKIINKISKLSKKYHKPLNINLIDKITQDNIIYPQLKNTLIKELDNATIFREVSILNILNYRANNYSNSVYKIRNGKIYVKDSKDETKSNIYLDRANFIKEHLINRIKENIENKTFYFPNNMEYIVPNSEKQFIGNIPYDSSIVIPENKNIVVAIHWNNLKDERVDLDFKALSQNKTIGWDYNYLGEGITFSGDITNAENGATEAFLLEKDFLENMLFTINNFTQNDEDVPFEFVIATTKDNEIDENYTINPNNIIAKLSCKIEKNKGMITIGILKKEKNNNKFCFNNFSFGNIRSCHNNEITNKIREYYEDYSKIQLKLKDLIIECNGKISDKPQTEELKECGKDDEGNILYKKITVPVDYDFSLENIHKDTIIKLFTENK